VHCNPTCFCEESSSFVLYFAAVPQLPLTPSLVLPSAGATGRLGIVEPCQRHPAKVHCKYHKLVLAIQMFLSL
jgi:hypothetical protein